MTRNICSSNIEEHAWRRLSKAASTIRENSGCSSEDEGDGGEIENKVIMDLSSMEKVDCHRL